MLIIDDPNTRDRVQGIVQRISPDTAMHEDLLQEALIHLWLLEERKPGQTRSWYLQSCKYHLQNLRTVGRSVDSPKRRKRRVPLGSEMADEENLHSNNGEEYQPLGIVGARDILGLLNRKLNQIEKKILDYLIEGYSAREIGEKLNISHPSVIKHRQKIAAMALKLGILPLPSGPRGSTRKSAVVYKPLGARKRPGQS